MFIEPRVKVSYIFQKKRELSTRKWIVEEISNYVNRLRSTHCGEFLIQNYDNPLSSLESKLRMDQHLRIWTPLMINLGSVSHH